MSISQNKSKTTARLKFLYRKDIIKKIKSDNKLKNINQVPRLEKIVINVGLGKAKDDKKLLAIVDNTLQKITGQKAIFTVSRMSIATFKLREGSKIGAKVTLRDERMYEFMDRLINIVLPRLRDFHGLSKSAFDTQGNYSMGLVDQSVFPELSYEETTTPHGMQITFVTDQKDTELSRQLLEQFGLPFQKEKK